GVARHAAYQPSPRLPSAQGPQPRRRHPRRQGPLPRALRLPRKPRAVRPPDRRVARQRPPAACCPVCPGRTDFRPLSVPGDGQRGGPALLGPRQEALPPRRRTPTRELDNYRDALRPLRKLFGRTQASEFGPLRLRAVREEMLRADLCRKTIN